jgi:ABC-2 type transport system ATP-binding protein
MQQKVQFIATVLHEPELIILDEPFSGFDPINAQILVDEILSLKEKGSTIIFSTHRMDSVELLCDHIALINKSEKVLDGEVHAIQEQYKKNQFEVKYQGNPLISDDFLLVSKSTSKDLTHTCIIELKQAMTNNNLIEHLISKQISLISFTENLPSMEEIFIMAVQQKHQIN